jgi:arylsulfatase A-like enzyme
MGVSRPPNIVWIVTTQWRAQACGFAGDPNVRTPYLDTLAAEASVFTQAVTPHPFGPFARAALLTGVPSPENGVGDYFDPLPADARTIAHTMRNRGYATAFFGKWHLGKRDRSAPLVGEAHARTVVPLGRRGGFEFWEGFESGFQLNDPWLHGTRLPAPVQFPGYQSDVVAARAAAWMRDQSAPWFCIISLETPHPPYVAPSAAFAPRDPAEIELSLNVPRDGLVEQRARRELAGYYAHIEATDQALGRAIFCDPALREAALVVTSVHGDMHGAHGLFRKGWPHEESVRVPLVVRLPKGARDVPVPARNGGLVSLLDLSRWTADWADGKADGAGSASAAEGQLISMPSVVALPDQCDRVWRGIRTAARKLVLNADGSPWLFFDLERDPGEMVNLVGEASRTAEIADWQQRILHGSR